VTLPISCAVIMGEAALEAVRVVGRYALFDEIASGGMATVYLGQLQGSGGFARTVAIKSLHPQFAKDPEFVSMFLNEARLAERIRHPNVVPTLDVVASRGEVVLVMEYVHGETLSRILRGLKAAGRRAPLSILLRIMSDVLQGLHAAHEARDERGLPLQIVHRDVSPQNVLVGIDGVARLLDFGVAKAAGSAHSTREGQIKGKLSYMAPEQLAGAGVTRQTDVYAASVLLWEALTGAKLVTGESELDLIAQLIKRQIPRPSQLVPDIPRAIEEVVMRGLEAMPEDRFATAREMCVALAACGVPEAPSITVGEWVQSLAADALAERSAKISAIETRDSDPRAALRRGMLSPSMRPPGESPTLPEIPAAANTEGLSPTVGPPAPSKDDSHSDVLSLAISPGSLRGGRRVRAWIAAGVLALLVAGATLVIERSVGGDVASTSPTPVASAATAAPAPERSELLVAVPPPLALTSDPPVSSSAAARVAPSPARSPAPRQVRRPVSRAAAPAAQSTIFDSRE
jgi:serine/threonine protein kinase